MTLLTWECQSGGGRRLFNLHRREWRAGQAYPEHGHDYHEVFWVDEGSLIHRWDGIEEVLRAGDLVAILPGERHAFRCRDASAIVNASFGSPSLAELRRRYGVGLPWPWDGGRDDRRAVLGAVAREQLRGLAALVDHRLPHSRDMFILGLLHVLAQGRQESLAGLPLPLRRAIDELLESDSRPTIAALARRLGCSREHLSRSVRRWTGLSPAALLRDLRLDRAEVLLLRGGDPLAAAAAAGFASLSGFYGAFRLRHGSSPGRWRRHSGPVAPGERRGPLQSPRRGDAGSGRRR